MQVFPPHHWPRNNAATETATAPLPPASPLSFHPMNMHLLRQVMPLLLLNLISRRSMPETP